jgi:hypothetical protein
MSRAFVNEDAEGPKPRYDLPERDDPDYDEAAAWALLEGARAGDTHSAEVATGYAWGEPQLRAHVRRILDRVRRQGDERMEALAERFLR